MEDGARHHLAECSDLLDAEVLAAKVGGFPNVLLSRHHNREPVSIAKNAPNFRPATDDYDHRFAAGPDEIQPAGDAAAQGLETGFKRRQFDVDPLLIEVAEFFRDIDADVGQVRGRDRHANDKRPLGSLSLRNACRH